MIPYIKVDAKDEGIFLSRGYLAQVLTPETSSLCARPHQCTCSHTKIFNLAQPVFPAIENLRVKTIPLAIFARIRDVPG